MFQRIASRRVGITAEIDTLTQFRKVKGEETKLGDITLSYSAS